MKKLGCTCLCLFLLSAVVGSAQNVWRLVPTAPRGPLEPDLTGAVVDAIAIQGGKQSMARVVLYGARKSGTLDIGIWINELSKMIPEEKQWEYIGPSPGPGYYNPRMIQITLESPTGKVQINSRMAVLADGNLPKGVDDDGGRYVGVNYTDGNEFNALLHKMNEGFDHGVVWIGRGVFTPPIEVKFGGAGIQGPLKKVLAFVQKNEVSQWRNGVRNHFREKWFLTPFRPHHFALTPFRPELSSL